MSNLGQNKFWKSIDLPIILLYIALVLIGWLNIYAAVFDESHASIFDLEKNFIIYKFYYYGKKGFH